MLTAEASPCPRIDSPLRPARRPVSLWTSNLIQSDTPPRMGIPAGFRRIFLTFSQLYATIMRSPRCLGKRRRTADGKRHHAMTDSAGEQREEMGEMVKRETGKMTEQDESKRTDEGMASEGMASESEETGEMTEAGGQGEMSGTIDTNQSGQEYRVENISKSTQKDGAANNIMLVDWDELAAACLLAENEEEIDKILQNLSDEELIDFIETYPEILAEDADSITDMDSIVGSYGAEKSVTISSDNSAEELIDGYIYLITNLVNGKKYVGQTTKSILTRWRQHVSASRHPKKGMLLVDRAIRKYEVDNFTCTQIESLHNVPMTMIDQRETYWIEYHKTYIPEYGKDAGYNLTRGGHGVGTRFTLQEEQNIIEEYCSMNKSNIEIARRHKMSPSSVRAILDKHDIPLRTAEEQAELSRQRFSEVIEQYDDENNLLKIFLGAYETAHWIIDNVEGMQDGSVRSIAASIRIAMYRHEYKYGYYWNAPNLSEAECQKRRESLCQRKRQYYLSHKKRVYNTDQYSMNFCPICGKRILPESEYCKQHAQKIRSETLRERKRSGIITPMLGGIPLTRVELEDLIRHYSVMEIGRKYGVSDNAVRKFARRNYDIDNIGKLQRFRLWNEEQSCYEYMPEFPMTWYEVCANLEKHQTVAVLAKHYKIRNSTLKKYLQDAFGEIVVNSELSKIYHHIAVYDKTIDRYFPNTYSIARYLLTCVNQITPVTKTDLERISRRIQRGLSKQSCYSIYKHRLYKVELQEYYESDRKYICNE